MKETHWLIFKDFIDKKEGGAKKAILSLLPKKLSSMIEALPKTDPKLIDLSTVSFLSLIHSSWYSRSFSFFSRNEASLFYFVVPNEYQSIFKGVLKEESPTIQLNELSEQYLAKELLRRILKNERHILPLSYLPYEELNSLIYTSKEKFSKVFELLSTFDLADELHLIIDKKKVETLQKFVSPLQARFIKMLKQKKDKNLFPPLGLTRWNGELHILESSLHKRAMQRLGAALSHSDDSFISYLKLRLSVADAEELDKHIHPSLSPKVAERAREQVTKVLEFLNSNAGDIS